MTTPDGWRVLIPLVEKFRQLKHAELEVRLGLHDGTKFEPGYQSLVRQAQGSNRSEEASNLLFDRILSTLKHSGLKQLRHTSSFLAYYKFHYRRSTTQVLDGGDGGGDATQVASDLEKKPLAHVDLTLGHWTRRFALSTETPVSSDSHPDCEHVFRDTPQWVVLQERQSFLKTVEHPDCASPLTFQLDLSRRAGATSRESLLSQPHLTISVELELLKPLPDDWSDAQLAQALYETSWHLFPVRKETRVGQYGAESRVGSDGVSAPARQLGTICPQSVEPVAAPPVPDSGRRAAETHSEGTSQKAPGPASPPVHACTSTQTPPVGKPSAESSCQ